MLDFTFNLQYGTSSTIANNWDTMQRNLHCCGGYGYKYWFHVDIYGTTGNSEIYLMSKRVKLQGLKKTLIN